MKVNNSLYIDIIDIIKEYKNTISQQLGDQLISVTLYGSYARGDYNNDSDVDILVILKKNATPKERNIIYSAVSDLEYIYDNIFLSVIVITEVDYLNIKTNNTFFYQNVRKEGIKI